MNDDAKQASELVRSGEYFAQARGWYQAMYIGPVSERSFFLIIAFLAILVVVAGIGSALAFFPLADRPGIVTMNPRFDTTFVRSVPLRESDQNIDDAFIQFFVRNYVSKREEYSPESYVPNYMFIRAHSDTPTFTSFSAGYTSSNPQSAAALLGTTGRRTIRIDRLRYEDLGGEQQAIVHFTRQEIVNGQAAATQWTATVKYYYTKVAITPVVDTDTGKHSIEIEDPQFQVVSYELAQTQ